MLIMNKKLALIIVGLGCALVILLLVISYVSRGDQTSTVLSPTAPTQTIFYGNTNLNKKSSVLPHAKQGQSYNYIFQSYDYPIQYQGLVIDYNRYQNKMTVYYDKDRTQAQKIVKKYYSEYGFPDPIESGVRIFFVGNKK
jgi:hypothetical protein